MLRSRCVYMLSFRARGVQAMDLCGTINGQDVFRSYILQYESLFVPANDAVR